MNLQVLIGLLDVSWREWMLSALPQQAVGLNKFHSQGLLMVFQWP